MMDIIPPGMTILDYVVLFILAGIGFYAMFKKPENQSDQKAQFWLILLFGPFAITTFLVVVTYFITGALGAFYVVYAFTSDSPEKFPLPTILQIFVSSAVIAAAYAIVTYRRHRMAK